MYDDKLLNDIKKMLNCLRKINNHFRHHKKMSLEEYEEAVDELLRGD
jgi:hypothetical protein